MCTLREDFGNLGEGNCQQVGQCGIEITKRVILDDPKANMVLKH